MNRIRAIVEAIMGKHLPPAKAPARIHAAPAQPVSERLMRLIDEGK